MESGIRRIFRIKVLLDTVEWGKGNCLSNPEAACSVVSQVSRRQEDRSVP
jgi:hypothetical protein